MSDKNHKSQKILKKPKKLENQIKKYLWLTLGKIDRMGEMADESEFIVATGARKLAPLDDQ